MSMGNCVLSGSEHKARLDFIGDLSSTRNYLRQYLIYLTFDIYGQFLKRPDDIR
jgi:hypothetical protein